MSIQRRSAPLAAVRQARDHGYTRDTGLRSVGMRSKALLQLAGGRRRPPGWRIGQRIRVGRRAIVMHISPPQPQIRVVPVLARRCPRCGAGS